MTLTKRFFVLLVAVMLVQFLCELPALAHVVEGDHIIGPR